MNATDFGRGAGADAPRLVVDVDAGTLALERATGDATDALRVLVELTSAEVAVLDAVARGLSNDRIADELGISRHTVKTHVNHITDKLGATNRTDAARMFLRAVARPSRLSA